MTILDLEEGDIFVYQYEDATEKSEIFTAIVLHKETNVIPKYIDVRDIHSFGGDISDYFSIIFEEMEIDNFKIFDLIGNVHDIKQKYPEEFI